MGSILDAITALLIILKLMGEIDISWWLVLAPSLIGWGFFLAILAIVVFFSSK